MTFSHKTTIWISGRRDTESVMMLKKGNARRRPDQYTILPRRVRSYMESRVNFMQKNATKRKPRCVRPSKLTKRRTLL